jgi:UDP-hydrolysing UDP-N-acetyl-D-glucosamine 2-epimerase
MPAISYVTSGRADDSPITPVINAIMDGPHAYQVELSYGTDGDVVLVLGDRYEAALDAVEVVRDGGLIAHIHGGEITIGSQDQKYRDAISQMARIHFCVNEKAKDRLEQMSVRGKIHVVGAPGLDNVARVMDDTVVPFKKSDEILLTWHSPGVGMNEPLNTILKELGPFRGTRIVWTGTNNDPGHEEVEKIVTDNALIDEHATDMGYDEYLRRARDARMLVGNSSSYVIEAPSLKTPSVIVGDRQRGRWFGPSVYQAESETGGAIALAMCKAYAHPGPWSNPYGEPGASARIADILMGET